MNAMREIDNCCVSLQLDPNLGLLRALGDPSRWAVLCRLAVAPAPLTVTEVASCCGVHLSGVSRHLSLLARAGVVSRVKQGREALYHLNTATIIKELRRLATAIESAPIARTGRAWPAPSGATATAPASAATWEPINED